MATIRERLITWIAPEQQRKIDELSESVRMLYQAQQERWVHAPSGQELIGQLRELGYDSGYLLDLISQIEWEEIGTSGSTMRGGARDRIAKDSRRQWIYNPLYQWSVNLWTNYGFGQQVSIVPVDENAIDVWSEFWEADRNDSVLGADNIQQASIDTLVDGNLFWAYHASDQDGKCTITDVIYDEIVEVLTSPVNRQVNVFYKRQFTDASGKDLTWYYPDAMAYFAGILDKPFDGTGKTIAEALKVPDSKRTDKMSSREVTGKPGTVTVMQFIPWNRKEKKDPFGWPLSCAAGPWLRSHRQFMAHRLTVSAAKAMFVRRKTVASGSRGVKSVIESIASNLSRTNYLDSNPAAAAGSVEVENKAVQTEDLPMTTGAGDAKTDNEIFTWMPSIALGVFPHYMGLGDAYRLATATSMERPIEMQFDRYQSFWQAQFRRMGKIVISFHNQFNRTSYDTSVIVTMDRLTEIDLDGASTGIGRIFDSVFQPALDSGILSPTVYGQVVDFIVNYMLEALGGNDVAQEIANSWEGQKESAADVQPQSRVMIHALTNYLDGSASLPDTMRFLREVM